jgi:predicted esterase
VAPASDRGPGRVRCRSMGDERAFAELSDDVYRLYSAGRHEAGLGLVDRALPEFPERRATITFWRACLLSVSGRVEEALETLRRGLEQGMWWTDVILRADADLDPLRGLQEFETLIVGSGRRMREEMGRPEPELLVLEPDRPNGALLLALHGGSGTAERFAPRWDAAREAGVTVAVPQSPYPSTSDRTGYTWAEPGAGRDVANAFDRVRASRDVDLDRLLLGGFSQGGRLAVAFALRGDPAPCRGVIAVAAAVRHVDEVLGVVGGTVAGPRPAFWLITGKADFSLEPNRELHRRLNDRGLRSELTVLPDLGHDFPGDFSRRIPGALRFLLGGDPAAPATPALP